MAKKKLTVKETIVQNIRNLKVGNKYSYPKFCTALGITKASNGSRVKEHMELILELIDYEMDGKQYLVLGFKDISENQIIQLTTDKRGKSENSRGNNSKYNKALVNTTLYSILDKALSELCEEDIDETDITRRIQQNDVYKEDRILQDDKNTISIRLTKHDLACRAGIRNRDNYSAYKNTPNYFSEYFQIDSNISKFLFPSLNHKSYSTVNSIINSLKNQGLAVISDEMEIEVVSLRDDEGRYLDDECEEDRIIIEKNRKKRKFDKVIATEDQRLKIEVLRLEVAKKMGFKNLSQLYNLGTQQDITEFHKKLNRLSARRFKIYSSQPYLKLTTSIKLIQTHLMKFECLTLEEFMQEGYKAYLKTVMEKIEENKSLDTNIQERMNRFEKLRKKGKEVKLFYNNIQKRDDYIEQSEKFVDTITNANAHSIPYKDKDISSKKDDYKTSYTIFKEHEALTEIIEEERVEFEDDDFDINELNNL